MIPEREMPGISASAWALPIASAWRKLICEIRGSLSPSQSPRCGARRRKRSKKSRRTPLIVRKIAAEVGEAKRLRSGCSSARPMIPAGIVPMTSTQPRRASVSSGSSRPPSRTERARPAKIRFQSSRKKKKRTSAVAQWVATRKARKNSSFWWMFQPNRLGAITAWPRLEIGNGSAIPCRAPRMMAWK